MGASARGIFIDLGGTFRIVTANQAYSDDAKRRVAELAGTELPAAAFHDLIEERYKDYRDWALRNMCEAPEAALWTRWLAFDLDPARLERHAGELTYYYRRCKGERVVVPGGVETVKELRARGYTLGIISDLIGCTEIDEWLDKDGLRPYFATVQQSSVTMLRKPHPAIYYQALREAGVRPEEAAFVGDNLKRDIIGAKETGFGLTIAVDYPDAPALVFNAANMPDGRITRFDDLLKIFPGAPAAVIGPEFKILSGG
ncbi:MAG: HAD family hydrolase [Peptococcaceae bacterium]|jgi:HAD superfamily hydrolase (TIGR01549 family)|nr:HAD family hydrolase [Peptococcaceae bacterium]